MNTIWRFVINLSQAKGVKKFMLLLVSAFLFAVPFMTKSLLSDSGNGIGLFAFLGWTALSLPLLTVFDFKKSLKRVFSSLFCFFFMFYVFAYSWFVSLYPLDFVGLGNGESIAVVIIAIVGIPLIHAFIMTLCVFVGYLSGSKTENVYLKAVLFSFGYVLGEYVQSLGTFAFPWARLFVGQTAFPMLLQSASLFGSYFITFIMVLVNALIAFALLGVKDNPKTSRSIVLIALAVFSLNLGFGAVRLGLCDYDGCKNIDAAVLQGNVPSNVKWTGSVSAKEVYTSLSDELAATGENIDIAVMPETAFPNTFTPNDSYVSSGEEACRDIAKKLDCDLFAGAFSKKDGKRYNSIFVFSSDGSVSEPYNKYNIVPFGEFLPYRSFLEAVVPVLTEMDMFHSEISRGESFYPIKAESGNAACLVCFDSIFPDTARRQVKNGADYIVVSTNDSWYKTSDALYQHADHSVMRAIENNVPVIRSANTGISVIVDSKGYVVVKTNAEERSFVTARVTLPQSTTLYTVIGDFVVPFGALVIACVLIRSLIKRKKASH